MSYVDTSDQQQPKVSDSKDQRDALSEHDADLARHAKHIASEAKRGARAGGISAAARFFGVTRPTIRKVIAGERVDPATLALMRATWSKKVLGE